LRQAIPRCCITQTTADVDIKICRNVFKGLRMKGGVAFVAGLGHGRVSDSRSSERGLFHGWQPGKMILQN
jgi:hypothetical protein